MNSTTVANDVTVYNLTRTSFAADSNGSDASMYAVLQDSDNVQHVVTINGNTVVFSEAGLTYDTDPCRRASEDVFENVCATIAHSFFDKIHLEKDELTRVLRNEISVEFDEKTCLVKGTFVQISKCKVLLETMLHSLPQMCDVTASKCKELTLPENLVNHKSVQNEQPEIESEVYVDIAAESTDFDSPLNRKGRSKITSKKNYEQLAPYKFFCTLCSFRSKRDSHFQKHMKLHEKVSDMYKCDKCSFTTLRMGHLRRHNLLHSTTTFTCDECSYKTDEHKYLMRHKKIKHGDKIESKNAIPLTMYQCRDCDYTTTKPFYYRRHLRVHSVEGSEGDAKRYQCSQCNYRTKRKEHYRRHVSNVHVNKRPYLCDFCGKAFKRTDALQQHRITHAETDPCATVFRCIECGKGCRSQAQLAEHTAVHSNVRSFLCEVCGASFKTRSVQRKHVLTIHKNPRAHACNQCSKRFNTSYTLRRHMKQHINEGKNPDLLADGDEHETLNSEIDNDKLASVENCVSEIPQETSLAVPVVPVSQLLQENERVTLQLPESAQAYLQANESSTALLYLSNNFQQQFT